MKLDERDPRYPAVQDYLFSLKARGAKYGIDRMALLAERLGHPERACPVIHVAGTNGKGSTAAMLESILRHGGWRTGLYTSPHLVRLGERVQVDRSILTESEIVEFVAELRPVAERLGSVAADDHPSFFEFMTAMAFLQFARRKCDIAIVEVGLGGRLDATNVVDPAVAVITSIGLDHCEMLGDTLERIAAEKAGIVKRGRPVVMGRVPPAAENVIRAIARDRNAPLYSVREEFGDEIDRYPTTNLEGDYQRWNAATASVTARILGTEWRLSPDTIRTGLDHAIWPGRWERVQLGGRMLVLDAAHNAEGAAVLDQNLRRLIAQTGRRPVVMVGVLGAARARPLLETVARHAAEIHLLVPLQARACTHDELAALIPPGYPGPVHPSTVEGLFPRPDTCTAGGPDDVLVLTGSIYLLGEVMARLQPERGALESRLQDF